MNELAKAFLDAVLKQGEFLGSLATAVFGACIVFIAWYAQRTLENANRPPIKFPSLIVLCTLLQGASILIMYLAYGTLVNIIPEVTLLKATSAKEFKDSLPAEFHDARTLFIIQFVCFFVGLLCLGLFALLNYGWVVRAGKTKRTKA